MTTKPLALIALSLLALAGCSAPASMDDAGADFQPTMEQAVRCVIAEHFGIEPELLRLDQLLADAPIAADDLDQADLLFALEDRFQVVLPDAKVKEAPLTPARLIALIQFAQANPDVE